MPRFDGPIHAGTEPPDPTAGIKAPATQCRCPGWCGGRDSSDWLTCRADCGHCNPRRRRPRPIDQRDPSTGHGVVQAGSGALDADQS